LSRFLSEPKTLVSAESEELNRALVLTLARSMHVTGTGNRQNVNLMVLGILRTLDN
jgi:mediator of RNA polymerase II transcription subunit 23